MTELTYLCTKANGDNVVVKNFEEAKAIKAAGGTYVARYAPAKSTVNFDPEQRAKRVMAIRKG